MGDYRGHITDVDLAWWRGAYQINELKIVKTSGKVPVPFLDAPLIDLSVSWRSLWYDHAVVAEVVFVHPELNFVDGGNKQNSQTGQGTDWRRQLEKLLPITLNEVRIENGTLTFRNFNSKPPVDLKATQLDASIRNLTNVRDEKAAATPISTAQRGCWAMPGWKAVPLSTRSAISTISSFACARPVSSCAGSMISPVLTASSTSMQAMAIW